MGKYFIGCNTIEEAKKQFRQLAKKYHPDISGEDTTAIMQAINAEFDNLCESLQKGTTNPAEAAETTTTAADFRRLVVELLKLSGIVVECVGTWVWVTGDTKQHKDRLKELGARWSKGKKAWYVMPSTSAGYRRGTGGNLQNLRDKYGSVKYTYTANDIV